MERTKPQCHPAFARLPVYAGEAEPGFEIDFLGIRTRCEYSAGAIISPLRYVSLVITVPSARSGLARFSPDQDCPPRPLEPKDSKLTSNPCIGGV